MGGLPTRAILIRGFSQICDFSLKLNTLAHQLNSKTVISGKTPTRPGYAKTPKPRFT